MKVLKSPQQIIVLVIVAIMISAGTFVLLFESDIFEEMVTNGDQIIDDRISPLTPQAVYLEVHRIRHKGIIDHMMNSGVSVFNNAPTRGSEIGIFIDGLRPGIGWREKPLFSFKVILDDFEWVARTDYETWDTDYMNLQIYKYVETEQETATMEFTFIDKDKTLLRTRASESDSFTVLYDFRTGRWSGDDSFNDSDGYGHFNGSNFELWFSMTQTDFDADSIPYWTEVNVLGTNPKIDDRGKDPDGDGVDTVWEWRWGYDPFVYENHTYLDPDLDGLQNTEEMIMEKWLANPFYPEIYLEVDEMEKAPLRPFELERAAGRILPIERLRITRSRLDGFDHVFWEESQQMLMELFNFHGITVHIDDGCMGGGGDSLPFGAEDGAYLFDSGIVAGFYANNFADDRKGIFRYVAVLHGGGWCAPQDEKNWFDCMTVPSNFKFFKDQLNLALSPRAMRIGRAVQVLHELGHSLGFLKEYCEGVDNSSRRVDDPNYPWLDYVSVMNYDYFRQRLFDYSDGSHGEFDANDWGDLDLTLFQRPWDRIAGIDFFERFY